MVKQITDHKEFNSLAGHITQSWEWGEFRKTVPSIKNVLRLGSFENEKPIKVWQILFSKVPYLGSNSIAYLPRGEMPTNQELEEIKKCCLEEKAVFLKIEPIKEPSDNQTARITQIKIGKAILPQHSIYVNLALSEDELLANMHEKARYNIRLAQKKGVVVKEENSTQSLEGFITILEETEKRQGFYSHNSNYYRNLWKHLHGSQMAYLLNAYVDSKIAASIMLFRFKDFLYYPYGGSDYEYRQYMAPQLLHFEAMKLGKKLGCKTYDLWGSYLKSPTENDPWWGFYRLKSGLGGKEISFPDSIDIPLSPLYSPLMLADELRWKLLRLKKKI